MRVQDFMAEQTERAGRVVAHFVATTATDKLTWRPSVEGSAETRSVLEQVGECVAVNLFFAAKLRGEDLPLPRGGFVGPEFKDGEEAQAQLIASADELATAIRNMDDALLEQTFVLRRGPTAGKNLIMMAYRNMAYHGGQINLIQLLAGDAEFHVSPSFY